MNPQETLAKLRESMPKVKQFLTASSQKVSDPELRARIAKVVSGLDENYAQVQQELPALLEDISERKAKAEAAMRQGLAELKSLRDELVAKAEAGKARVGAETERLRQLPRRAVNDDPDLGRRLCEGLIHRYVSSGAPHRASDVKSPSFEDWADSVVNLKIPPAAPTADSAAAAVVAEQGKPPKSFESWFDSGISDNQNSTSGSHERKMSEEEIEKRRQDVLNYYRKADS